MEQTGPLDAGNFLDVLTVGQCEPLKAAVHGAVMATVAVCAVYNVAAWLARRERHLAINSVIYCCATYWELRHVQQHLECVPAGDRAAESPSLPDAA
jgi:hypothetical protein